MDLLIKEACSKESDFKTLHETLVAAACDAGCALQPLGEELILKVRAVFGVRLASLVEDPIHPYPDRVHPVLGSPEGLIHVLRSAKASGADVLRLRYLPATLVQEALVQWPHHGVHLATCGTSIVTLRGAGASDGGPPRSVVRSVRKHRRRMEERLGKVRFEALASPGERVRAVEQMIAWKQEWQRAQRLSGFGFNEAAHLVGLRAVAGLGAGTGFHVFALTLNDAAVAVECGFRHDGVHLGTVTAYEPAYAAFGVGKMLTVAVIEDCQRCGLEAYDFLPPETPYKSEFTDAHSSVAELLVPLTWRAQGLLKIKLAAPWAARILSTRRSQ